MARVITVEDPLLRIPLSPRGTRPHSLRTPVSAQKSVTLIGYTDWKGIPTSNLTSNVALHVNVQTTTLSDHAVFSSSLPATYPFERISIDHIILSQDLTASMRTCPRRLFNQIQNSNTCEDYRQIPWISFNITSTCSPTSGSQRTSSQIEAALFVSNSSKRSGKQLSSKCPRPRRITSDNGQTERANQELDSTSDLLQLSAG